MGTLPSVRRVASSSARGRVASRQAAPGEDSYCDGPRCARRPPGQAPQPPQKSPPPGTACRDNQPGGLRTPERQHRLLQSRGRAGCGAHKDRAPALSRLVPGALARFVLMLVATVRAELAPSPRSEFCDAGARRGSAGSVGAPGADRPVSASQPARPRLCRRGPAARELRYLWDSALGSPSLVMSRRSVTYPSCRQLVADAGFYNLSLTTSAESTHWKLVVHCSSEQVLDV